MAGAAGLLLSALRAGRLDAPHLVVSSGGGLHCYWRLPEPVSLESDEAQRQFKAVLQRVVLAIGGQAPSAHADANVADVARVLRVPGTLNHKQEVPRPVQLITALATEDCLYRTLTAWRAALPAQPLPVRRTRRRVSGRVHATDDGALSAWMRRVLTERTPEGRRHDVAIKLMVASVRRGVAEDHIAAVADRFSLLNDFPQDEMGKIRAWAVAKSDQE